MTRGTKPKSAALKRAEGNPGKRSLPPATLLEMANAPQPPIWISHKARLEWKKLIPHLVRRGTCQEEDAVMLAQFCEAVATLVEARKQLKATEEAKRLVMLQGYQATEIVNTKGRVTKREIKGGTVVVNPLHYVIRDQISVIARISAEFGLTPAARARLNLETKGANLAGADPLEAIIGGEPEHYSSDPVIN